MAKTAILHIITRLDLGGAQKSCLALIQELQNNYPDFEVYLISGTTGELVSQAQTLKNVFLLKNLIWEINPKNIWLEIYNFYQIFKIMHNLKIKHAGNLIIHTHTIKAGTIGRWCAFLAGIKTRIHTIHGFGFNVYQNKLIWMLFYLVELFNSLVTSHFICVSSQDQKAGSEIFPFFYAKSSIIRAATLYPSDLTNQFIAHGNVESIRSATYTIGTIASLKTGKNLFELLKAFKWACKQNTNLRLEVIGDGPLRPALEKHLKQHDLHNQVKLLGWQANTQNYTKNWNAFIFTSLWEGLPCVIIEMLDRQIPVISYQVGGISDLIEPKKLYYHGKWLDLAQAIVSQANSGNHNLANSKPHQPDIDFYIPKMALDHAMLYSQLMQ